MANTLTNLAADMYRAADIVARELTGFIAASTVNVGSEQAAVGQTVRSHFTRSAAATDISPSMTIPEGTDQTVDNKTLTLTRQKAVQIPYTGEDVRYLNAGAGYETVYGDQIEQAMRTLSNLVEADLATEAYTNASRAYGTAGTTPFADNFNEIANLRKILADNGAPVTDGRLSLVIDTTAGVNLRNLAQLQKVNESGNERLLRQGELLNLQGFSLKESAQVQAHTKGSGSGYLIDNSGGYAAGDSALHVDTGSDDIKTGDVITIAGDTNKYVVNSGFAGDGDGDIEIGTPGLLAAAADNAAITIGNSFTANVGLHQAALELAMRAPANPAGGDAADDTMVVQDPRTGLSFLVSFYKGYHKAMIEVAAVWGYKAWKPDFITLLLG